jgi:hypothetical protein
LGTVDPAAADISAAVTSAAGTSGQALRRRTLET